MMKFCLIDVSNLVHRAKHSVGNRSGKMVSYHDPFADEEETNPNDERIGMILSVVFSGIANAFNKFGADHCVAAFDKRSWRRDFYPDYKANRRDQVKTPDEERDHQMIVDIIDKVRDFLRDFTNVTVLEHEGAEADDFIARWVQLHDDECFHNIIISADGDFKHLVRDNVHLYNPMGDVRTLYTPEGVFQQGGKKRKGAEYAEFYDQEWIVKVDKKTGEPVEFDYEWELFEKCIRGDTSDNISSAWPGVRKTKMLKAYNGSVEDYNNFINSRWGGKDKNENSVKELFERNKTLIDLTAQPDDVKDNLDFAIDDALGLERAKMIGAYFAKFCSMYKLPNLSKQADRYVSMLSKGYPE